MSASSQRSTLIDLFNSSQKDTDMDPIIVLVIISLVMSYMIYVSFIGIFSAKLLDYYEFYPRNTSSSTLLNSSFYILKLTPAVCFNFLNIILGDTPLVDKTAFSKVTLDNSSEHRQTRYVAVGFQRGDVLREPVDLLHVVPRAEREELHPQVFRTAHLLLLLQVQRPHGRGRQRTRPTRKAASAVCQ